MFKIIFIVTLVIAFVPPVRRFLFWLIVGKQMVNEQKKANTAQQRKQSKEGEIHVDFVPKKNNDKDSGGQYVEFEEID
jgi:UPF0716 family protein affecting phage T7 exclusion